ncbi:MAG: hypothetical protein JW850_11500 [Thermoflexales bacterium]|nr:hypothetical protein [Thermoflexales bacterium]
MSFLTRVAWLPAALAVLILVLSWARRAAPGLRGPLMGVTVIALALAVFFAAARPSPAGVQSLNVSLVWQAGLALLAAVLIATTGGWLAGKLNSHVPQQPSPTSDPPARCPSPTSQPETCDLQPETSSLPPLFLAEGARVLVTGPSRSGKSTVLHHLCRAAMADPTFDEIVLLDGKGPELIAWAGATPVVSYCGPEDIAAWIAPLERIVQGFPARYAGLVKAGLRRAEPGGNRKMIVIDEVQRASRIELGKKIMAALLTIAEQSGALGDVLVITTQRATHHSLDKSISYNANLVIALTSPEHPGRFELYSSLAQKRPARRGQARPAGDADITAWAAELTGRRAGRD